MYELERDRKKMKTVAGSQFTSKKTIGVSLFSLLEAVCSDNHVMS